MAYFNQDMKRERAPEIRKILKAYGLKGSLSVRNHMMFILTISQGPIDFIGNAARISEKYCDAKNYHEKYCDVNIYRINDQFDGAARDVLNELYTAMNRGNWDNSNSNVDYFDVDYFDVGYYVSIMIGKHNKPYVLI